MGELTRKPRWTTDTRGASTTPIPITVLTATLGVPDQKLRRLEIGTRADNDLELRATLALKQIESPKAA